MKAQAIFVSAVRSDLRACVLRRKLGLPRPKARVLCGALSHTVLLTA